MTDIREQIAEILDHQGEGFDSAVEAIVQLFDSERLAAVTPVAGYTRQSAEKLALVNGFKLDEERLLRKLDALADGLPPPNLIQPDAPLVQTDGRMLALGKTYLQIAFMLINRAVFQPQRIALPEDAEQDT